MRGLAVGRGGLAGGRCFAGNWLAFGGFEGGLLPGLLFELGGIGFLCTGDWAGLVVFGGAGVPGLAIG